MSEKFLTLNQARTLISVSRATLWRWQTEHGLKVIRIGGVARIRESDLQAFLKRHESGKDGTVSKPSMPNK